MDMFATLLQLELNGQRAGSTESGNDSWGVEYPGCGEAQAGCRKTLGRSAIQDAQNRPSGDSSGSGDFLSLRACVRYQVRLRAGLRLLSLRGWLRALDTERKRQAGILLRDRLLR